MCAGDVLLGAERLRDGRQDELRVVERRERHPEDAVREAVGRGARRLQREACLADAARAGERQQARLARAQEVGERVELAGAAEERRRGDGQVGAVEALQRRELGAAELVDPLGRGEVLEAVLAEVVQVDRVDEPGGGGREEDLAAVAAGGDARGAVDVDADVALVGEERRAAVEAHAHADRPGRELLGRGGGRGERGGSGGEGDEERVALRVDLDAAAGAEGAAQDAPVLGERVGVALLAE